MIHLIPVCIVALAAALAPAQDREQLLERVNTLRNDALSAGINASDRDKLLGQAIAAREALMAAHPADPMRPIWLLDQAADALLRLSLSLDDARLVVGLHDLAGRDRALAQAEEAFALADTAGGLIDDRFRAQEALLDAGEVISESDRALNRRLAEQELAVRRPLLMGRAMALQVAGAGPEADANEAIQILQSVRVPAGTAARLRDASMAIALRSREGRESSLDAREVLSEVLKSKDTSDSIIAEAILLDALLAGDLETQLAALREVAQAAPFVTSDGLSSSALTVLAVETRARVFAEAGQIERAVREVLALEERRDLGGLPADRVALADSRLSVLAQRFPDWSDVPPELVRRAARSRVARDEARSDARARQLLERMLTRMRIEADEAAKAGDRAVAPIERDPARLLLARLYLIAPQGHRDPGQAATWQNGALDLVVQLLESVSSELDGLLAPAATLTLGPSAEQLSSDDRLAVLRAAIDRLPGHPSVYQWRLGRAALLLAVDAGSREALQDAEAAVASDDQVTRGNAIALAGAIHTTIVASLPADARDARAVETLRRAVAFLDLHPNSTQLDADALRLRLAGVLMERANAANARETLELLRSRESTAALKLIARAHDVLGARDRATRTYRSLSERVSIDDGKVYWEVWVRLLELIDLERQERVRAGSPASGSALARTLRSQILRLQAQDDSLGGREFQRRLDAIADRLDGGG